MFPKLKRTRVTIPEKGILQLHRNARPELYGEQLVDSLRNNLDLRELSRYPDIDSFLGRLSKFINIDTDNILLTSGVDGAVRTVIESTLCLPSRVAVLTPTYKMYEVYAEAYELDLIRIPPRKNLTIDIPDILRVIPQVDAIFIPNPHEPVESVFSREDILEIVKKAEEYKALIIVDEAYFMFGAPTVIDFAPNSPNLLVMRSFSKGFGLPSIRLGYLIANKELISQMSSRRLAYETNSLSISIAGWALENFNLFESYIKEVISSRSFLKEHLLKLGFKTHGSFSNTILIDMTTSERAKSIQIKLRENGILVRELTEFRVSNSWISVTVGNMITSNIFLDTFKKIV